MAEPLRQTEGEGGALYRRPPVIESLIDELSQLPKADLVVRSKINEKSDPDYIPTECVLHFFRQTRGNDDAEELLGLFKVLRQRVLKIDSDGGSESRTSSRSDSAIQNELMDNFTRLLCRDREEYLNRLDFFECRFNGALANLRIDAMRKVLNDPDHVESLVVDKSEDSLCAEDSAAFEKWKCDLNDDHVDFLYRDKLHRAINRLAPDYRRVIELLFLHEAVEPGAGTMREIGKLLNCTEKTVRNRRDGAIKRLRELLGDEE